MLVLLLRAPGRLRRGFFFVLMLGLLPPSANANVAIGASPALIEIDSNPGATEQRQVTVKNSGSAPIAVKAYVWDWRMSPKGKKEFAPPGSYKHSVAPWIQVAPQSAVISPGSGKSFDVLFAVPKNASGGNYGVLFFETVPDDSQGSEQKVAAVNARIGVLLLHRAKEGFSAQLAPTAFSLLPPSETEPLTATFSLKNGGDAHALPFSKITILDKKNQLVANLEGAPGRVFPGQERSFSVESAVQLKSGDYRAILTIQYDLNVTSTTTRFLVP